MFVYVEDVAFYWSICLFVCLFVFLHVVTSCDWQLEIDGFIVITVCKWRCATALKADVNSSLRRVWQHYYAGVVLVAYLYGQGIRRMTTAASDVLPQVPLRPYMFRSLRVNATRKSGIDLSPRCDWSQLDRVIHSSDLSHAVFRRGFMTVAAVFLYVGRCIICTSVKGCYIATQLNSTQFNSTSNWVVSL